MTSCTRSTATLVKITPMQWLQQLVAKIFFRDVLTTINFEPMVP